MDKKQVFSLWYVLLAFIVLVGVVLIADGFEFHIPRGYVYVAMAFSALVESLNLWVKRRE